MSTHTDKNEEWFSPGIKNLSKKHKDEKVIKEFQLSKMCLHCVCSKRCNGAHDKEDIEYYDYRDISYAFKSFCKDPKKHCKEINNAIEQLIQDPESMLHEPNFPIVNTCVHNHIQNYCKNCSEGRTSTFMIDDKEFRYCWSKQLPGKNTLPIGIHWDVKMTLINDEIDSYEIIPFSKDFSPRSTLRGHQSNDSMPSHLSIDTSRTSVKSEFNAWNDTPTTYSGKSRVDKDSSNELQLIMKENKLLNKEISLITRDFEHQINRLNSENDSLKNENDILSRKSNILREQVFDEVKENIDLIDKTVSEQFMKTYY